jgi:hypothetical protein
MDEDKPSPNAQRCQRCREWIRMPISRSDRSPIFICDECVGAKAWRLAGKYHSRESGEAADRQYHGGLHGRGEW